MQSHDPKIPFPPYWAQPSSTPTSTTTQDKSTFKEFLEKQKLIRKPPIDIPSPPGSTKSSEGGIGEAIVTGLAIQAGIWAVSKTMEIIFQPKPAKPETPPPAAAPARPSLQDLNAAHEISCARLGFFASSESKEKCAQIKEAIRRMAAVEAEAVISPKPN